MGGLPSINWRRISQPSSVCYYVSPKRCGHEFLAPAWPEAALPRNSPVERFATQGSCATMRRRTSSHGAFLSHGGIPSSHPFLLGIFQKIIHFTCMETAKYGSK